MFKGVYHRKNGCLETRTESFRESDERGLTTGVPSRVNSSIHTFHLTKVDE